MKDKKYRIKEVAFKGFVGQVKKWWGWDYLFFDGRPYGTPFWMSTITYYNKRDAEDSIELYRKKDKPTTYRYL